MLQYNDLSSKIRELTNKQMDLSLKTFQEIFKDECSQFQKCFSFYAALYDLEELLIVSFHPPKDSPLYLSSSPLTLFLSRQKNPTDSNIDEDNNDNEEDDDNKQDPALKWFYRLLDLAQYWWEDYFEWLESDQHQNEDLIGPHWQVIEETENLPNPIFIKLSRENVELTLKADLILQQDFL